MAEKKTLDLSNWHEFKLDDLDASEADKAWNRYAILKQAEINTFTATVLRGERPAERMGTLSSALSGGRSDPLPDN
jgi:hypothetical protein